MRRPKSAYYADGNLDNNGGSIETPYFLPAVACCHRFRRSHLHQIALPKSLREDSQFFTKVGRVLAVDDFKVLRESLYERLGSESLEIDDILPGNRFLPVSFTNPCKETAFVWGLVDFLVVNEATMLLFGTKIPKEVTIYPIEGSEYYMIYPRIVCPAPDARLPEVPCDKCFNPNINAGKKWDEIYDEKSIPDECNIFKIDTTPYVVISDDLKLQLENLEVNNVDFEPLELR